MPLIKGPGSVKKNVKELTTGKVGSARSKAIRTLAKKWKVSVKEAKFRQALIIAKSKAMQK